MKQSLYFFFPFEANFVTLLCKHSSFTLFLVFKWVRITELHGKLRFLCERRSSEKTIEDTCSSCYGVTYFSIGDWLKIKVFAWVPLRCWTLDDAKLIKQEFLQRKRVPSKFTCGLRCWTDGPEIMNLMSWLDSSRDGFVSNDVLVSFSFRRIQKFFLCSRVQ